VSGSDERRFPCLEIERGPDEGRVVRVYEGTTVIGRTARQADVAIDGQGMSRRHAKLVLDGDGRAILSDLGSTNGTVVDGKKIASTPIAEGARIELGPNVVLVYRSLPIAELRARERDAGP
jgi:pSer/pThr/pTyr-binding forkhead associated (FHA) protein